MTGQIGAVDAADEGEQLERIRVGHCLIIGGLFGCVIRHDPKLLVGNNAKEDYERTIRHLMKDGRVVRLDYATIKTQIYEGSGGLQTSRTLKSADTDAKYMLKKYPKYVKDKGYRKTGSNKGMRELSIV